MLLHPLVLFPLAFELVLAGLLGHELKCQFKLEATASTQLEGPEEYNLEWGLELFGVRPKREVLATFDELNDKDMKYALAKPGLVEELKRKLGKNFKFDLHGRCFPEPGEFKATFETTESVLSGYMVMEPFSEIVDSDLRARYPDEKASSMWDIAFKWNHDIKPEDFLFRLSLDPLTAEKPYEYNSPDNGFTIRPIESNPPKFEWHRVHDWFHHKPNIESDYFCALEAHEQSKVRLWSWDPDSPVYTFKHKNISLGVSIWELAENTYESHVDEERKRFYVQKDKQGVYFLNIYTNKGRAYLFALSFV